MHDCDATGSNQSLPGERDFDPWNGGLDAQCAWKNFGGLSLEEANSRFRENPCCYQEDFMFMGGKAFAFYFPVIESYLLETVACDDGDDREAWILAKCIQNQFRGKTVSWVVPLTGRIVELARFVRNNLQLFDSDPAIQRDIGDAWQELEEIVQRTRATERSGFHPALDRWRPDKGLPRS